MNYHDLYDRMTPYEYEALRRKKATGPSVWFMVLVFFVVMVALLVIAEIFFAPTNEVSAQTVHENEYYCAHLSEYRMSDYDREKITSYCDDL